MRRTTVVLLLLPLLFAILAPALASDDDVTNETCPVMVGEPVDPDLWVEHDGRRIYFCCEDCVDRFKADPERYMANLAVADPDRDDSDRRSGREEEHRFGVLHFILVHFPIALSGVAAMAALLGLVIRGPFFRHALTFTIVIAAAFAVPTYLTGEEAEEAKGEMTESLHEAVERHATFATVSMYSLIGAALLQLLSAWRAESPYLRVLAVLAVLGVAGLVAYTGYLGGEVHLGRGHLDALLPW